MTSEVGWMPTVIWLQTLSVSVSITRIRFWYDQQLVKTYLSYCTICSVEPVSKSISVST